MLRSGFAGRDREQGNRTMMANDTGRYTSTYDDLSRRRSVTNPAGQRITYTYNALSQRICMSDRYCRPVSGRGRGRRTCFGMDLV
ncbi:MAG: hypothetical protein KF861_10485 [Planctomycetaceae bacterium]|nr:hypothetical protein [Planctomycetaceae bacterium]